MKKDKSKIAVKREDQVAAPVSAVGSPFSMLRHEIDRLFDDFSWPHFRSRQSPLERITDQPFWRESFGSALPATDLVERDTGYELQMDLPGLKREDIDVKLADGAITISGEKSAERTEDKKTYHLQERSYGSFQRTLSIPPGVDAAKVDAKFENGTLTVSLPKSEQARQSERHIEVSAA